MSTTITPAIIEPTIKPEATASWSAEVLSAQMSDSGVVAFRVQYSNGDKTIVETMNLGYPDGYLGNILSRLDQLDKASAFVIAFSPGPVERPAEEAVDPDQAAFDRALADAQACQRAIALGMLSADSADAVAIKTAAQQAFNVKFLSRV